MCHAHDMIATLCGNFCHWKFRKGQGNWGSGISDFPKDHVAMSGLEFQIYWLQSLYAMLWKHVCYPVLYCAHWGGDQNPLKSRGEGVCCSALSPFCCWPGVTQGPYGAPLCPNLIFWENNIEWSPGFFPSLSMRPREGHHLPRVTASGLAESHVLRDWK